MAHVRPDDRSTIHPAERPGARHPVPRAHPVARWATIILGVVFLLVGAVLVAGGVWLMTLGGSWYYLIAGLGLVVVGVLLMTQRMAALWLYLLIYLGTWIWAVWEVGWEGWPLVPRVVAPTVLLVLVLFTIPVLRRTGRHRGSAVTLGASGAAVAGLALAAVGAQQLLQPDRAIAQEEVPPVVQAPAGESGVGPAGQPAAPAAQAPAAGQAAAPAAASGTAGAMPMLETGADWPAYGGTIHGTRYSPLDQISRDNVASLERAWEYRTGDMPDADSEGEYAAETTPLKIGDDLLLCSAMGDIIAVDAATGLQEWRFEAGVSEDAIPYSATCRGVAYYADPAADRLDLCAERVLVGTLDARLIAVDARTGQACTGFGRNGQVDLERGLGDTVPGWVAVTSPSTIVRGVAVMGHQVSDGQARNAPSGVIRGYDAVTGELLWAWDLGNPGLTGLPPEGETYTRGTPNMWTIAAGDEDLGLVYLPMGNSAVDYWGGDRSAAENEYATALVAIDVTTGRPAWHFQTVHYDVWDYDLGSQPALVDFPAEGGTVPAVILSSKQGDIFVLDRRTGEPLHEVEEVPVPQGGVEPERLSPTQPVSRWHSLLMPDLTERQMWGMSPLDQMWCRIQFRRAYYEGPYTPPTADRPYIQFPGYNGGQDWGSLGFDPVRGVLIANYNNTANYNRLVPREVVEAEGVTAVNEPQVGDRQPRDDIDPQVGTPYGIQLNAGWRAPLTGILCTQPPYGGIRAIDLATGETLWDRPLGSARRNGPFGIPSMLPFTIGTPNNGGPVVTAGGLIFIAATTDNLIRAIDIETGETLWEDVLPAGGQSTPMVYEQGGRQYLVMMAGGHHFMETPIGDHVIAWTLPQRE